MHRMVTGSWSSPSDATGHWDNTHTHHHQVENQNKMHTGSLCWKAATEISKRMNLFPTVGGSLTRLHQSEVSKQIVHPGMLSAGRTGITGYHLQNGLSPLQKSKLQPHLENWFSDDAWSWLSGIRAWLSILDQWTNTYPLAVPVATTPYCLPTQKPISTLLADSRLCRKTFLFLF